MRKKMYADIEIKQLENDLFSVKMDGQEISQYITAFSLSEQAGGFPVFTVTLATDTINLSTRALHEIPKPYDWAVDSEVERRMNSKKKCSRLKMILRKVRGQLDKRRWGRGH